MVLSDEIKKSFEEICKIVSPEHSEKFVEDISKCEENPELVDVSNSLKFYNHIIGSLLTSPFNIENSFRIQSERYWDYFFVYVDIHGTILEPDYGGLAKKYYPHAEKTLKMLSDRKDVSLVLYTCSHKNEISEYLDFFGDSGIYFDGINHVHVENTRGGDFTEKPYFNVVLEDKAGFVGDYDWYIVDHIFSKFSEPKVIRINTPKGQYDITMLPIAKNRAEYYACGVDGEEVGSAAWKEEVDWVMKDNYEAIDWLINNMDWVDVEKDAVKVNDSIKVTDDDFWTSSEDFEIIENGGKG